MPARILAKHVHRTHHSGWMRASVLGANDGLVSIAGLIVGVAATRVGATAVLVAGVAGLVAGALSMGAGEYVSVSSQADIERADIELERVALRDDIEGEHDELRDVYIERGLDRALATEVARQLMAHDALGAHARDDIGITDALTARPLQAAAASTLSFALGGAVPLLAAWFAPAGRTVAVVTIVALAFLALLGALAARAGGAGIRRGAIRVFVWGTVALAITYAIGSMFHIAA